MAEANRQLVVVVEGMAALGPYGSTILTDSVEKIARYGRAHGHRFTSAGNVPLLHCWIAEG